MLPDMAYAKIEYTSTQSVEAQWDGIPRCVKCAAALAACSSFADPALCLIGMGKTKCVKCL